MSKVVTEEKLKILADVIDREFENLNQELDESSEKSNGNNSRIML